MKTLLIASIYLIDCAWNKKWLKLQKHFIEKTTTDFDYGIVLSGNIKNIIPELEEQTIIGHVSIDKTIIDKAKASIDKIKGLQVILDYYYQSDYKHLLILDSDAFPIMSSWQNLLVEKMKKAKRKFAAPIRFENLDVFPNTCAFFILDKELEISFKKTIISNLLGEEIEDSGTNLSTKSCFPLIRTNTYNHHPLFGAIYYNTFYHHGCGSRDVITRTMKNKYYDHITKAQDQKIYNRISYELFKNPELYINELLNIL